MLIVKNYVASEMHFVVIFTIFQFSSFISPNSIKYNITFTIKIHKKNGKKKQNRAGGASATTLTLVGPKDLSFMVKVPNF